MFDGVRPLPRRPIKPAGSKTGPVANTSCTSYIQILGATAIDNLLASEQVVWTFFLRVGDCTGLLGVTVESISSGEIGTRHWTGEQGAAAVVAAEECTKNEDLE